MLDKAKSHEKDILKQQEIILEKVRQKTEAIKAQVHEGTLVTTKFKRFFDKKMEIENLLNQVDQDSKSLKEEFNLLLKKATAFNITSKSASIDTHVKELNKELKKIDRKRETFKKQLNQLVKLIKG